MIRDVLTLHRVLVDLPRIIEESQLRSLIRATPPSHTVAAVDKDMACALAAAFEPLGCSVRMYGRILRLTGVTTQSDRSIEMYTMSIGSEQFCVRGSMSAAEYASLLVEDVAPGATFEELPNAFVVPSSSMTMFLPDPHELAKLQCAIEASVARVHAQSLERSTLMPLSTAQFRPPRL